MTSIAQRAELHAKIWRIANDVRGTVDGWDFKQYVLGALFYRYISEHFSAFMEQGAAEGGQLPAYRFLDDTILTPELRADAVNVLGFYIYPSHLFANVAENAYRNPNLNTDLRAIFDTIEHSAQGAASEPNFRGLFADFDTTSSRLGNSVEEKNRRLAAILSGVASLKLGEDIGDHRIDLFGDAYEFLISNYAANAGKSGGEFFTPQCVSRLLARLAIEGQSRIDRIYDPACGSGSLLLQVRRSYADQTRNTIFYGQEINHTTYNLARMNMFLHRIDYNCFRISLGDTLLNPSFGVQRPFDAIVSNPPYSVSWIGKGDPTLINDERYAPAGVLAPQSKADFAFVLHALNYLSAHGRAVIVCFPGIFYRGGAEQKIRKYLVQQNYVRSVIALPPNLFYGTSIAVNILVLSKGKLDTRIQFIDASGEEFFSKETNNNLLSEDHIARIVELFFSGQDVPHRARWVATAEVEANNYALSVGTYVQPAETREAVDIVQLNAQIADTVKRIDGLRAQIDAIVAEIEA